MSGPAKVAEPLGGRTLGGGLQCTSDWTWEVAGAGLGGKSWRSEELYAPEGKIRAFVPF